MELLPIVMPVVVILVIPVMVLDASNIRALLARAVPGVMPVMYPAMVDDMVLLPIVILVMDMELILVMLLDPSRTIALLGAATPFVIPASRDVLDKSKAVPFK